MERRWYSCPVHMHVLLISFVPIRYIFVNEIRGIAGENGVWLSDSRRLSQLKRIFRAKNHAGMTPCSAMKTAIATTDVWRMYNKMEQKNMKICDTYVNGCTNGCGCAVCARMGPKLLANIFIVLSTIYAIQNSKQFDKFEQFRPNDRSMASAFFRLLFLNFPWPKCTTFILDDAKTYNVAHFIEMA